MNRRLLLDSDVVAFLEGLPKARRRAIWKRLLEIAEAPDRFEDFQEFDATGRQLAGHIFSGCAIVFWDDRSDRHLKILEINSADDFADYPWNLSVKTWPTGNTRRRQRIMMTLFKSVGESGERHTLVVYYNGLLRYDRHDLYDSAGKPESTSGY